MKAGCSHQKEQQQHFAVCSHASNDFCLHFSDNWLTYSHAIDDSLRSEAKMEEISRTKSQLLFFFFVFFYHDHNL